MQEKTAQKLIALNREFYQRGAESFSATRQRIQPGMARILDGLADSGSWLDIGCGNGNLARAWLESGRKGRYKGVDFSQRLLGDARNVARDVFDRGETEINFFQADISKAGWQTPFEASDWDGVFLFAVLHHIPSLQLRERLLNDVAALLHPQGCVYISVWQPQHSAHLWARRQPWEAIGLTEKDVDEDDILLDWKAESSHQAQHSIYRYVHVFKESELKTLAANSGFRVLESFSSDGRQKNLALYQIWQKPGFIPVESI